MTELDEHLRSLPLRQALRVRWMVSPTRLDLLLVPVWATVFYYVLHVRMFLTTGHALSLISPALAPLAIYHLACGWAYMSAARYVLGYLLCLACAALPFMLDQPG